MIDEGNHVTSMAANCPNTKMVLGGYSQGAAVTGYVTSDRIPDGYTPPEGITGPMAPEVANHVAAVALFGTPSNDFLARYDAPPIAIGQAYKGKTIQLCEPGDPICCDERHGGSRRRLCRAPSRPELGHKPVITDPIGPIRLYANDFAHRQPFWCAGGLTWSAEAAP